MNQTDPIRPAPPEVSEEPHSELAPVPARRSRAAAIIRGAVAGTFVFLSVLVVSGAHSGARADFRSTSSMSGRTSVIANDGPVPTPAAMAVPTEQSGISTTTSAVLSTSSLSARFVAGTYTFYRFDSAGTPTSEVTGTVSSTTTYSIYGIRKEFGGRWYIKLTSGPFAGSWVWARRWQPVASTSYTTPAQVTFAGGSHTGFRFYQTGRVVTRRSMTLAVATTYSATARATFGTGEYVYLSSGPMGGRWVPLSSRVRLGPGSSPAPSASASATPRQTATPNPTLPPASPSPSATASPTVAPTPSSTPSVQTTTWKTLVLVYRETDVTFRQADGTDYRLQARMSDEMYRLALDMVRRTGPTISSWSGDLAGLDLDIVNVAHPIRALNTLSGGKYWVGSSAVAADLDTYAPDGSYDSVFVIWQHFDSNGVSIPVGGWGLTIPPGSWSNGAGFTSVIVPSKMWWWTGDDHPEEVFVHEWLHQAIFHHENMGRLDFDLHAGPDFGYQEESGSWQRWYSDVMRRRVWDGSQYLGIGAQIWRAGTPTSE